MEICLQYIIMPLIAAHYCDKALRDWLHQIENAKEDKEEDEDEGFGSLLQS